jgi:hypothetical protein
MQWYDSRHQERFFEFSQVLIVGLSRCYQSMPKPMWMQLWMVVSSFVVVRVWSPAAVWNS